MSDSVSFENVSKIYGATAAVDSLDLEISEGEFFTLLGPSGSGKTTSLRMLAGLESISRGRILVGDTDVSHVVPEDRNVGLVFQNYALFPHLTVSENIAFPLKMRKVDKSEIADRVARVVDMVGLKTFKDRYPKQLSGGQQQRVALARAFVFDPTILLMDEPLGALDRNLRDQMRVELKALQERIGATVLYVTHDQDEALAMSDRIGIMHNGVLQQVATPADMYDKPLNSFVANFLGDSVSLESRRTALASTHSTIEVDGLSTPVHVERESDVSSDESGVLVVRPEAIKVHHDEPVGAMNKIRGIVETRIYLGSTLQVRLREAGGALIEASLRPKDASHLDVGSERWLSWSPEDARFVTRVE